MPLPDNPYEIIGKRYLRPDGVGCTVVAIARVGVIVNCDDGGQMVVPAWLWPGDLSRLAPGPDPCRVRVALAVGGMVGIQHDRLVRLAQKLRVYMAYHDPAQRGSWDPSIPPDVEFVVVLKGCLGHPQYTKVVAECRKRGLPHADIDFRGFEAKLKEWLERTYHEKFGAVALEATCPVLGIEGYYTKAANGRWMWHGLDGERVPVEEQVVAPPRIEGGGTGEGPGEERGGNDALLALGAVALGAITAAVVTRGT